MQTLHINSTLQGGKYRIISVLGQGGFGITYLAEQVMLRRKVAIKEFFYKECCERDEATSHVTLGTSSNREIVQKFKDKFLKEACTISQLEHPNIIKIHDIFEENHTAYYVMEYIEGENLSEMVKRQGALPEATAVAYIKKVADALAYIHARSINHLDVKPGNIMLRQHDQQIVLIDFGLSKQYDAVGSQTSSTPIGVSQGYAPIEQYSPGGVPTFSPSTDIYSLGATLYWLIIGKTPPNANEVLNMGLPPMPSYVSASVKKAIESAMEAKKKDRPQSVAAFLKLLDAKQSVPPPPPPLKRSVRNEEETQTIINGQYDEKEKSILSNNESNFLIKKRKYENLLLFGIFFLSILTPGTIWVISELNRNENASTPVVVAKRHYVITYSGDYIWDGKLNENRKPHGEGVSTYVEGDKDGRKRYEGKMSDGKRTYGKLTYMNGDIYEGSFQADHFGDGTFVVSSSGEKFKGSFQNDQPYNGKWYDKNGKVFEVIGNGKCNSIFTANGVSFIMVYVEGGSFNMGATNEQGDDADNDEKPVHNVALDDYYIGETEVTQELWHAVMGNNPSHFAGNNELPVEQVSWDDCQAFIKKLNQMTGQNFHLPSEAQWEYAARGGRQSRGYKYSGNNNIADVAWFDRNSEKRTHPVRSKDPNELGLFDMSGNVLEWCQDRYGAYNATNITNNPMGPSSGSYRVLRGGSWGNDKMNCRSSNRNSYNPTKSDYNFGLRLAQ